MKYPTRFLSYMLEPGLLIGLAVSILVIPIPWLIAWGIAVIVHELGHLSALYLCSKGVYALNFGSRGVKLHTEELGEKEGICAAAGPIASFLLFVTCTSFPRLRICGLIHSLFNLLPIYPLDGGRVLKWFLSYTIKVKNCDRILWWVSLSFIVLLSVIFLILMLQFQVGLLPFIFLYYLLEKSQIIKYSCKDGRIRVQ